MENGELNNRGIPWFDLLYLRSNIETDPIADLYWVASERVYANPKGYASYGLFYVNHQGCSMSSLTKPSGDGSTISTKSEYKGIRPVITLESGIKLSAGTNTTHTTQDTAWTIVKE